MVFITIDTLRADFFPGSLYPRSENAPFLGKLVQEGVTFQNAHSQISHTAPSHTSMFTGLYPFQHGVLRNHETLPSEIPNTYSVLKEAGVSARAFPSVEFLNGKVSFPLSSVPLGLNEPGREKKLWYLNCSEVVDNALKGLEDIKTEDRFFTWLHFYDVHQWEGNGNVPDEYRTLMEESATPELFQYVTDKLGIPASFFKGDNGLHHAINGYDARLRFVDDQIKRLHDALKERGLLEGTVFIITSDHGEGLGNHNFAGHGEYIYEEQLRVPLLFWRAGLKQKRSVSELVRLVDLFPTFLDLYGISAPKDIEGVSLLNLAEGSGEWGIEESYAERRPRDKISFRRNWRRGKIRAIQNSRWKLIEGTKTEPELYDLQNDPLELENKVKSSPTTAKVLSDELDVILNRHNKNHNEKVKNPELSDSEIEELRSLGYL